MSIAEVCVVCDAASVPTAATVAALNAVAAACPRPFRVSVLDISSQATPRDALRPVAVRGRRPGGNSYFSIAVSTADTSIEVGRILSGWNAAFIGCDRRHYALDQEDITMMTCYSEVPMRNFVVVDGQRPKDVERLAALTLPVVVRGTDQPRGECVGVATDRDELAVLVAQALEVFPKIFAVEQPNEEDDAPKKARLLVAAFGKKDDLWTATDAPDFMQSTLQPVASAISANLLTHTGTCEVHLLYYPNGRYVVTGVAVGFPLWDPLALGSPDLFHRLLSYADDAHAAKQPNYVVVFDAKTKGYHLRAARFIKQGSMVFPDEGRTFAIVTKEHVRATWSDEDKVVFTRYAWPLDSEGHVYAIWEEDPKRWRPINHACNPTCIHVAPHSLNVVAARDIAEGEDLTMDYATFCDYTMKPFNCHCGAAECRGLIQPDAASLSKYGKQAWHRGPRDPLDTL